MTDATNATPAIEFTYESRGNSRYTLSAINLVPHQRIVIKETTPASVTKYLDVYANSFGVFSVDYLLTQDGVYSFELREPSSPVCDPCHSTKCERVPPLIIVHDTCIRPQASEQSPRLYLRDSLNGCKEVTVAGLPNSTGTIVVSSVGKTSVVPYTCDSNGNSPQIEICEFATPATFVAVDSKSNSSEPRVVYPEPTLAPVLTDTVDVTLRAAGGQPFESSAVIEIQCTVTNSTQHARQFTVTQTGGELGQVLGHNYPINLGAGASITFPVYVKAVSLVEVDTYQTYELTVSSESPTPIAVTASTTVLIKKAPLTRKLIIDKLWAVPDKVNVGGVVELHLKLANAGNASIQSIDITSLKMGSDFLGELNIVGDSLQVGEASTYVWSVVATKAGVYSLRVNPDAVVAISQDEPIYITQGAATTLTVFNTVYS